MQDMDWRGVRAMVFDMDGTLLNTEQVIVHAASQTLEHLGHGPLPEGYRMPNMFGTAADLMADVLIDRGVPLPPTERAQLGALFERFYAERPAGSAPLYEGVREWLQYVHERGIALAVCTNKQYDLAIHGLEAAGILPLFDAVTGRDTCGIPKPAPDPLLHTLSQLHVPPQDALYFGDTHVDAACADAAGVRFVWFSAGFGTPRVREYPQVLAFTDYPSLQQLASF